MLDEKKLLERIVIDPEIMVGKPVIKGTRIPIEIILHLLIQGKSKEDIKRSYPRIEEEDITACLLFAVKALDDVTFFPTGDESCLYKTRGQK